MGVLVEAYLVLGCEWDWNGYAHEASLVRILRKQEKAFTASP